MLSDSASPTNPISEGRDERRQQILASLRRDAAPLLERLADELVDLPDDRVFGAIEYTLRNVGHELAAKAHQAGIDAGKKRGTKAPASSARTAPPTPGSSTIGPRVG